MDKDAIWFYSETTKYKELSNFYKLGNPIKYNDKLYPTSEHLYHALKYEYEDAPEINKEYIEIIRTVSTPNKSKIVANQFVMNKYDWQKPLNEIIIKYRKLGVKQRSDWHSVKVEMMMKVLRLKFEADEHCRKVLLSTGNKKLVEASPRDSYWGCRHDGTGQNKLGELLMQLRDEIVKSDCSEVFS